MGIDTKLREMLKVGPAAAAWKKGKPKLTGYVTFDDLLTRFFRAIGPHYNFHFTGAELYTELMRPVRADWASGCMVYVLICDDQKGVPQEKSATQAKRSSSDATEPYANGVKLTLAGVSEPEKDAPELIDVRRLMRTRHMRAEFCQLMEELMEKEPVPVNRAIVFHYSVKGPAVFRNGLDELDFTFKKPFGEADLAIYNWALRFAAYDKKACTTDSDFMPIYSQYYECTGGTAQKSKFYWVYDKEGYVDMQEMMHAALRAWKVTTKSFLMLCIFSGTDFFDKSKILHMIGPAKLLPAVQGVNTQLTQFHAHTMYDDMYILQRFLHCVYGHYVKGGIEPYLFRTPDSLKEENHIKSPLLMRWSAFHARLVTLAPKSLKPPAVGELAAAVRVLRWNYEYWTTLFRGAEDDNGEPAAKKPKLSESAAGAAGAAGAAAASKD